MLEVCRLTQTAVLRCFLEFLPDLVDQSLYLRLHTGLYVCPSVVRAFNLLPTASRFLMAKAAALWAGDGDEIRRPAGCCSRCLASDEEGPPRLSTGGKAWKSASWCRMSCSSLWHYGDRPILSSVDCIFWRLSGCQ